MLKKLLLFFIILTSSIGFSQEKSVGNLIASPNPFSNSTHISFNSLTNQNVIVTVKNVLGKTVFSKEIDATEGKNMIPFYRNDLRSGMYIYAIQSNKDYIFKRFVIR